MVVLIVNVNTFRKLYIDQVGLRFQCLATNLIFRPFGSWYNWIKMTGDASIKTWYHTCPCYFSNSLKYL